MEKLTKEELQDSAIMFRAIMKLTNSVMNFDNLDDGECPFFIKKMKFDITNYTEWLVDHTKVIMDAYIKEDADLVIELIHWFTEIESNFHMDDFHSKELVLFISKNISAINDLKTLMNKRRYFNFVYPIVSRFEKIQNKGYMDKFKSILDSEEFQQVVQQMDSLGSKIISESNE